MKKILVLFPKDWDRLLFAQPKYRASYLFYYEGFDLFRFPENARLIGFDILRFVERLAAKYRRIGLDGIVSNNEQFGALAASLLAERLGLPGLHPATVITAQHKFYARERLKARVPALMPDYAVFPYSIEREADVPLPFPFFVKPVKATYSVLARRVDTFADLQRHLTFNLLETFIIKRLVKPFNDVMRARADFRVDAHHLIAESLLEGRQVSVEGLVQHGEIHVLGIVDALMYPGTQAFLRWEYPSRLPADIQSHAIAAAKRIIEAMEYNHGFFNVELIIDTATSDIKLVEINPRMASQFSDLYDKVDRLDLHGIELQLSCAEKPDLVPREGTYRCAASFVFRKFDGTPLMHVPTPEKLAWLAAFDPDAHLMLYIKHGRALAREMKWLGSHRYAVLNMGGKTLAELTQKHETVKNHLEFETG